MNENKLDTEILKFTPTLPGTRSLGIIVEPLQEFGSSLAEAAVFLQFFTTVYTGLTQKPYCLAIFSE